MIIMKNGNRVVDYIGVRVSTFSHDIKDVIEINVENWDRLSPEARETSLRNYLRNEHDCVIESFIIVGKKVGKARLFYQAEGKGIDMDSAELRENGMLHTTH